jgi:hypothetical protein
MSFFGRLTLTSAVVTLVSASRAAVASRYFMISRSRVYPPLNDLEYTRVLAYLDEHHEDPDDTDAPALRAPGARGGAERALALRSLRRQDRSGRQLRTGREHRTRRRRGVRGPKVATPDTSEPTSAAETFDRSSLLLKAQPTWTFQFLMIQYRLRLR